MSGEVCVVTGGGRGIGRACAKALGAAGHAVVVDDTGVGLDGTSPGPGAAQTVAAEVTDAGGTAMALDLDAGTSAGANQVVAEAEQWAGRRPTVLVHAAGTLRDNMVHKASDEDWAQVMGSHLAVAVELTRAMTATIRERGFGRIVYVGGAAGLMGNLGQAAYATAKAALFGLTRAVALELARYDACVNYLVPFAFTRMTESIPPVTDLLRRYLAWAPLSTPDDIAPVVAWLCSQEAAGVSGQVIGVRGAEVALWSQPRPVAVLTQPSGWDAVSLGERIRAEMQAHFTPLESEFDLLASAPVTVSRDR